MIKELIVRLNDLHRDSHSGPISLEALYDALGLHRDRPTIFSDFSFPRGDGDMFFNKKDFALGFSNSPRAICTTEELATICRVSIGTQFITIGEPVTMTKDTKVRRSDGLFIYDVVGLAGFNVLLIKDH